MKKHTEMKIMLTIQKKVTNMQNHGKNTHTKCEKYVKTKENHTQKHEI